MDKVTQINHLIQLSGLKPAAYGLFLITSKVLDARRRGVTTEAYDQYAARPPARRAYAPEGGAIEGNAADDALMVDQGVRGLLVASYFF
jgi:hypothetical protein